MQAGFLGFPAAFSVYPLKQNGNALQPGAVCGRGGTSAMEFLRIPKMLASQGPAAWVFFPGHKVSQGCRKCRVMSGSGAIVCTALLTATFPTMAGNLSKVASLERFEGGPG